MISERVGNAVRQRLLVVGAFLAKLGLTPNMVTLIGFFLNVGVAIIIAKGYYVWGGALLIVASAFDMLDGAVARATGGGSKLGGFLDSTIDRYSEIVGYMGVLIFMLHGPDAYWGSILTLAAATGALMVSYSRARAEASGWKASVGILARPERVLVLGVGLMLNQTLWALAILAVGTHLSAIMRMLHVYRLARAESAAAAAATIAGDSQPS